MNNQARAVAVRFLEDLFEPPKHIDSLSQDPEFLSLDSRDRRFVTELVYGVLRNRERLDHHLSNLSQIPLHKLDPAVLWILRVALYQLEFMRIPDHAAVHETVELCRHFGKTSAAGFVNAMLRSFLREKPRLPEGRSANALAVRFSHPQWLVKRYLIRYGVDQTEELLARNNKPPMPFLWVNIFKTNLQSFCRQLEEEKIHYKVYSQLPSCAIVPSPSFTQHRTYQKGLCFFMDPASQEVAYLANVGKHRVLGDFCCAPGGKSFILASQKAKGSKLYCCDASFRRLKETRERARLHQVPDLNFIHADLTAVVPFREPFDFVLLDVPCSGLGTLRSNPDIRWKICEQDLQRFHSKQVSLLQNGFAALREGGELLYATCSTEPEENESVIEEFLTRQGKASLIGDFHRTFPAPHPGDCFFAARIRHIPSKRSKSSSRSLNTPSPGLIRSTIL